VRWLLLVSILLLACGPRERPHHVILVLPDDTTPQQQAWAEESLEIHFRLWFAKDGPLPEGLLSVEVFDEEEIPCNDHHSGYRGCAHLETGEIRLVSGVVWELEVLPHEIGHFAAGYGHSDPRFREWNLRGFSVGSQLRSERQR